jgi:hypothetical protein
MKTQRGFIGFPILVLIILGVVVLGGGAYFLVSPSNENYCLSQDSNLKPEEAVVKVVNEFERFQGEKNLKALSACLSDSLSTSFAAQADPFPFTTLRSYFVANSQKISDDKYTVGMTETRLLYKDGIGGGSYPEESKMISFGVQKDAKGGWVIVSIGVPQAITGGVETNTNTTPEVSSPVSTETTSSVSTGSAPSVEVTRVALPKIYISYANLPPSQWGIRGENFLIPIPPLTSGGTGSTVVTLSFANALPPPGNYQVKVYANNANSDLITESKSFYINSPATPTIISFTATPNKVSSGQAATLSWSSSNVEYCKITRFENSGGQSVVVSNVGGTSSHVVHPTASGLYQLQCFGSDLESIGFGKERQSALQNIGLSVSQ